MDMAGLEFEFCFLYGSDTADTMAVRTCSGVRYVPVNIEKEEQIC